MPNELLIRESGPVVKINNFKKIELIDKLDDDDGPKAGKKFQVMPISFHIMMGLVLIFLFIVPQKLFSVLIKTS